MSDSEVPNERTSLLRRNSRKNTLVPHGEFSDRKRWWSIRVMYLTMFLSSVTFTLTISSIWPFLRVLDHSATTDLIGWVVAAYSLGQLVASPLFGMWANFRGQSKEPLAVSITLGIGANLMYAYLESIPGSKALYMIVARGLIGFGAGNVAVVRSYVAGATTLKERTAAMANVSIFQSIGFILGPVIQAAFVPMSYPGLVNHPGFHLNMYTAPAILGAILCVVNVVLLFTVFREYRVPDAINVSTIQSSYEHSVENYKPNYFAVISCIIIFFAVLFIFTVFETIATPLSMDMFAWTKAQSTLYIGVILAGCGVEAIGVFIVLKMLSRRFNERYLLIGGFVLCLIGYFVQIPWGDGKVVIAPAVEVASHNITSTDIAVIARKRSLDFMLSDDVVNSTMSELFPQIGYSSEEKMLIPLLRNLTTTASTVGSTISDVVVSTAETFIEPLTLTAAEQITTDLTAASLETATEVITTQTTLTEAELSSAATIITPDLISTAKTITTTMPTTITTASTLTSTASTISSTHSTTLGSSTSTEKILSTFSTMYNNQTTTAYSNSSTTVEPVGCPATMDWCFSTPPVYLAQFIVGCIVISAGYPTANVMSYTLYSKILGPKPQGLWMGWLTASGSLARTLGPIFVSQIYYSFGPRVTFAVDCGIILVTILGIIVVFKKLVPCKYTVDYPTQNGTTSNS